MVSAGLDTVPGNLVMGLAYLSSEDGMRIQKKAYEEIQKVYPDNDVWEKCLVEEKVPYVTALVKEILRFWTVIPICLPRKSIKDIQYESATIPAGTTFFMVCYISSQTYCDLAPILTLFFSLRTPGQQTMTKTTSKTPINSSQSGTWTAPIPRGLRTTATVPALACVPALISRIASCTRPLSGSSQPSPSIRPRTSLMLRSWTLSSAMPSQRR